MGMIGHQSQFINYRSSVAITDGLEFSHLIDRYTVCPSADIPKPKVEHGMVAYTCTSSMLNMSSFIRFE